MGAHPCEQPCLDPNRKGDARLQGLRAAQEISINIAICPSITCAPSAERVTKMVFHMLELEARLSTPLPGDYSSLCARWIIPTRDVSILFYDSLQLSLIKKHHCALIATGERGTSRKISINNLQGCRHNTHSTFHIFHPVPSRITCVMARGTVLKLFPIYCKKKRLPINGVLIMVETGARYHTADRGDCWLLG